MFPPEESFASAFGGEAPVDAEGEQANNGGITLDDLFKQDVDLAVADEINRASLSPSGTYQSDPGEAPLNAFPSKVKLKDADGNETGQERLVITLTGRAVATIKGKVEKAGLRVRMSPDRMKKVDFESGEVTDKDDLQSRLWAQAIGAFKAQFGEAPKSMGAVVQYLTEYPVRFRVIQIGVPTKSNPEPNGEPGNLVMSISPVRKQRGR
jgi:hypothetical protein